jgi:hypothetical protein
MLKYSEKFASIKKRLTFVLFLIRKRYKFATYQIRKVEVLNSVLYIKFMSKDSSLNLNIY